MAINQEKKSNRLLRDVFPCISDSKRIPKKDHSPPLLHGQFLLMNRLEHSRKFYGNTCRSNTNQRMFTWTISPIDQVV